MSTNMIRYVFRSLPFLVMLLVAAPLIALAEESCNTQQEMDSATNSAIERTVSQFFDSAARGDAESMRRNAIAPVANQFQGIAATVSGNKDKIAGGRASIRSAFLLSAPGNQAYERAEFFCGLFNSPQRTTFVIPNLPPGNYAVAIQDVSGSKVPFTITYVLQSEQSVWKLAGYYARPRQVGPHDGLWYWVQARDLKKKGQDHNSFFYYSTAAELLAPVPFMSTTQLDKLYDEQQNGTPKDLPTQGPVSIALNGKTYQIQQVFPIPDDKEGLDLVVKYAAVGDISNASQAFQDNMNFIKALASRYPEYRSGFTAIVARAVAPTGQDYGTMLPMKDIK